MDSNLQTAISKFWRALRLSQPDSEKYRIRNNLANCLSLTGRYIEALSLLEENIRIAPQQFESLVSWGNAAESLLNNSYMPSAASFYFVLAERYVIALNNSKSQQEADQIQGDIDRVKLRLLKYGHDLTEELIAQNRLEEHAEYRKHTKFRKFVLGRNIALSEHSLYCRCSNSKHDDLGIALSSGSVHISKPDKLMLLENYICQIKSEFSFSRILYYKFIEMSKDDIETDKYYVADDKIDTRMGPGDFIGGYIYEHIKTSFKVLYGVLDKIASAILIVFDIDKKKKSIHFENFFGQFKELDGSENIHLHALYSLSLDLSRNEGNKVGSLKIYKDIRNKLEHNLLLFDHEVTNIEKGTITAADFEKYLIELLRVTKSAIFSLVYLIRTETILRKDKST